MHRMYFYNFFFRVLYPLWYFVMLLCKYSKQISAFLYTIIPFPNRIYWGWQHTMPSTLLSRIRKKCHSYFRCNILAKAQSAFRVNQYRYQYLYFLLSMPVCISACEGNMLKLLRGSEQICSITVIKSKILQHQLLNAAEKMSKMSLK